MERIGTLRLNIGSLREVCALTGEVFISLLQIMFHTVDFAT